MVFVLWNLRTEGPRDPVGSFGLFRGWGSARPRWVIWVLCGWGSARPRWVIWALPRLGVGATQVGHFHVLIPQSGRLGIGGEKM